MPHTPGFINLRIRAATRHFSAIIRAWGHGDEGPFRMNDEPRYAQQGCTCDGCLAALESGSDVIAVRDNEEMLYLGGQVVDDELARQQWQQRCEDESRRQQELRAKYQAAEVRAKELLPAVLSPSERQHYRATGDLVVKGSDGKRYKVLEVGTVSNVMELCEDCEPGCSITSYCCHPVMWSEGGGRLPLSDAYIGQILALRHDVTGFKMKAPYGRAGRCKMEVQEPPDVGTWRTYAAGGMIHGDNVPDPVPGQQYRYTVTATDGPAPPDSVGVEPTTVTLRWDTPARAP